MHLRRRIIRSHRSGLDMPPERCIAYNMQWQAMAQAKTGIASLHSTANHRRCNGHHNRFRSNNDATQDCTLCFLLRAWVSRMDSDTAVGGVVASRVPVSLRCGANAEQVGDYVFASGTWVIEGDKRTFPLQTAEIQCDRTLLRSLSATVQIGYGGQFSRVLLRANDAI